MKIYFAGSIRAGRDDAAIYKALIARLQAFGDILTEHVGNPALSAKGDDGLTDRSIHDRDMDWLKVCDVVIAEITTPSLGVGYELGWAQALKKPVLCLHRSIPGRPVSAMIAGSPGIETKEYACLDEACAMMEAFLQRQAKNGLKPFSEGPDK